MFIDKVRLVVESGKGGDGAVTFRREKFVPKGGPDGGDGGNGGNVILKVDSNKNNLYHLRHLPTIKAENGKNGRGKKMHGAKGKDIVIKVPPGTSVFDEENGLICDLLTPGKEFVIARGGRGGKGNIHFSSPRRQHPEFATKGRQGETKRITLELKSIADVGIVGYPNVGKSTLLNRISSASPKIANYPFTTLSPNLGVVEYEDYTRLTFADIPGVVKGASEGKGLGLEFLKHIERTKILLIILDITSKSLEKNYLSLITELQSYSDVLLNYPRIIAVNKIDVQRNRIIGIDEEIFYISALKGIGVKELLEKVLIIYKSMGGKNAPKENKSR
jgi:GTP-binding protein